MKIPRDISGKYLYKKKLRQFDHEITRQSGSHIRLTTDLNGTHHITIPAHNSLNVGTIAAILKDVSNHLAISKDQLINKLFG